MPGAYAFEGGCLMCFGPRHPTTCRNRNRMLSWVLLLVGCVISLPDPCWSIHRVGNVTSHLQTYRDVTSSSLKDHTNRNGSALAFCGDRGWTLPSSPLGLHGSRRGNGRNQYLPLLGVRTHNRVRGSPRSEINGGTPWTLNATKEVEATPRVPVATLGMTEGERMKVCSTLDTLFSRCVTACERDCLSEAMNAITDYIRSYGSFFSPFFEDPLEVSRPPAAVEDVSPGDELTAHDVSPNPQDQISHEGNSDMEMIPVSSDKSLSFYYTVDDVGPDGKTECRRWYVSIKPEVTRCVRRLIMQYRKRCMGIMGRAMHKVSTMEDLRAVTRVSREASRFGMTVMKAMYDAMSVIHAKLGRFGKALGYIERMWSLGERRRYRSYEPLLTYFEEHLDSEGMLSVLHHMVDAAKLPVSGLMFTRVMVTIGLSARRRLLELTGHSVNVDGATVRREEEKADLTEHVNASTTEQVAGSPADDAVRNTVPVTAQEVYQAMRRQIQEVLDIYHKHTCNRVSLSSRLGYVISTVFESVAPGAIRLTHVSPAEHQSAPKNIYITTANSNSSKEEIDGGKRDVIATSGREGSVEYSLVPTDSYGACVSCDQKLHLLDLSVEDRLKVFRSWLQHIYDYNFPEIPRLANFYAWLYSSLREGRGYTCILDGQNIGYHKRQLMSPLDLNKIDTVVREMVHRDERPLIVLPYYARVKTDSSTVYDVVETETLSLLFPGHSLPQRPIPLSNMIPGRSKRYSAEETSIVDRWVESRQAYFCTMGSYDDNYFFMANVMSGCAEELEVMAHFLKSSLQLSFTQKENKGGSMLAAKLPTPTLEDYTHIAGAIPRRPVMITVTNDTFTNLEIPNVDEGIMRALRDIPLTPYIFTSDGKSYNAAKGRGGYKVLVGNRLRYSLEMHASGTGRYHIPLGYERKVIDCKARHTIVVHKNEQPRVEPPLGGLLENAVSPSPPGEQGGGGGGSGSHNVDQELKQTQSWLEKYGYDELLLRLDDVCPEGGSRHRKSRGYVISTKTPEITTQKFNPSQQTRWLCIDLTVLDRFND